MEEAFSSRTSVVLWRKVPRLDYYKYIVTARKFFFHTFKNKIIIRVCVATKLPLCKHCHGVNFAGTERCAL